MEADKKILAMKASPSLWRYGSLDRLERLWPHPSIVLRQRIWWTEKNDGSCTCAYLNPELREKLQNDKTVKDEKFEAGFLFASRNQPIANVDIMSAFKRSEQRPLLMEMLREEPDYYCFGEMLIKGRSPARFELHEKDEWIGFDIKSIGNIDTGPNPRTYNPNGWLTIPFTHQRYYQFGIPTPKVHGESIHKSLAELIRVDDDMVKLAMELKLEGFVAKTVNGIFRWKTKVDVPRPQKISPCEICRELLEGRCKATLDEKEACEILNKPQLPALPDSEAFGAIDKVFQELGMQAFKDKSKSMPLVAEYITVEMNKHLYGKPPQSFYYYYTSYLRDKVMDE